jgi:acetyl-CoA synthetase
VPDEVKGETPWAFVVLRPGVEGTDNLKHELRERVCTALGKSFAPEKILFVHDLPKTRSAKILRRAIRSAILGRDPGDLSNLDNPQALREIMEFT